MAAVTPATQFPWTESLLLLYSLWIYVRSECQTFVASALSRCCHWLVLGQIRSWCDLMNAQEVDADEDDWRVGTFGTHWGLGNSNWTHRRSSKRQGHLSLTRCRNFHKSIIRHNYFGMHYYFHDIVYRGLGLELCCALSHYASKLE